MNDRGKVATHIATAILELRAAYDIVAREAKSPEDDFAAWVLEQIVREAPASLGRSVLLRRAFGRKAHASQLTDALNRLILAGRVQTIKRPPRLGGIRYCLPQNTVSDTADVLIVDGEVE